MGVDRPRRQVGFDSASRQATRTPPRNRLTPTPPAASWSTCTSPCKRRRAPCCPQSRRSNAPLRCRSPITLLNPNSTLVANLTLSPISVVLPHLITNLPHKPAPTLSLLCLSFVEGHSSCLAITAVDPPLAPRARARPRPSPGARARVRVARAHAELPELSPGAFRRGLRRRPSSSGNRTDEQRPPPSKWCRDGGSLGWWCAGRG